MSNVPLPSAQVLRSVDEQVDPAGPCLVGKSGSGTDSVISVGSSRSGRDQDAVAQQVELRPATNLSLDDLVAVDCVLDGAANTMLLGTGDVERAVRRLLG